MATQAVKVIDIERSYIPMDPNSFPESMHATGGEDAPEVRVPAIVYDGDNFVPTGYGFMSYFGINSLFNIDALVANCDDLFIVQTQTLDNILVALTETGIWTKAGGASGAWTNIVVLAAPPAGEHRNWTKCVIGNNVYMYRAGNASAYQMNLANLWIPTLFTPSFLNMAAQQGIFKAGGRLAFWDSANSIAWANLDNVADFIPSLETGAGNTIFTQIVGRIVACRQHGDGFVIYCTRSIIAVRRTADANFFFSGTAIFTENGISYYNECVHGQPDTVHFAYTTFGMLRIQDFKSEYIMPEIFTYFKESRQPVYLRFLEGRFLFFEMIDPRYVTGIPNFSYETIPASTILWQGATYAVDNIQENPCRALKAVEKGFESRYLNKTFGFTTSTQAIATGSVPIWQDHLSFVVPRVELQAFVTHYLAGLQAPRDYFNATAFTNGAVVLFDSPAFQYTIPASVPDLLSAFSPEMLIEANTGDFFNKQDMIWFWERQYMDAWKDAIDRKVHAPVTSAATFVLRSSNATSNFWAAALTPVTSIFGPYADLSYFSEANLYYGIANKSAWAQRSLTRGISVSVTTIIDALLVSSVELTWRATGHWNNNMTFADHGAPVLNFTTHAAAMAGAGAVDTWWTGTGAVASELPPPWWVGQPPTNVIWYHRATASAIAQPITNVGLYDENGVVVPTGPLYDITFRKRKTFFIPRFVATDYNTCVYKELAYTSIKGHGHYTLAGAFVVDNATPEAADYTDICLASPVKKKNVLFNGIPIPQELTRGCVGAPVTIQSILYSYPDEVLVLPPGSFLMQRGSIEPIYPVFPCAFVYDLQYKKWGKCSQEHRLLLNYSPVNTQAGDQPVPYDIFSVNAGCLLTTGKVAIFDKFPVESRIVVGKIGYFRKGYTDVEEIRLQFRNPATGTIEIQGSLDGKLVHPAISQLESFTNVQSYTSHFESAARWFNIVIRGIFDLKNLDFSGTKKGKR